MSVEGGADTVSLREAGRIEETLGLDSFFSEEEEEDGVFKKDAHSLSRSLNTFVMIKGRCRVSLFIWCVKCL